MTPGRDLHIITGDPEALGEEFGQRVLVRWVMGRDDLDDFADAADIAKTFDQVFGSDDTALGRCMTITLADAEPSTYDDCLRLLLAADALRTARRSMHWARLAANPLFHRLS